MSVEENHPCTLVMFDRAKNAFTADGTIRVVYKTLSDFSIKTLQELWLRLSPVALSAVAVLDMDEDAIYRIHLSGGVSERAPLSLMNSRLIRGELDLSSADFDVFQTEVIRFLNQEKEAA